ncbi:MAG: hypothetical protein QXG12_07375 [Thermoproteota archaeon]
MAPLNSLYAEVKKVFVRTQVAEKDLKDWVVPRCSDTGSSLCQLRSGISSGLPKANSVSWGRRLRRGWKKNPNSERSLIR